MGGGGATDLAVCGLVARMRNGKGGGYRESVAAAGGSQTVFPGLYPRERDESRLPIRQNFRHSHELCVYAGVAIIDNIGLTASVVLYNNRVDHRHLYIHGLVLGTEQPTYLNEVAALHALRTIRDWLGSREEEQTKFGRMTLYAGDAQTAGALRRWYEKGELKLQSAAASPLARALNNLEN